MRRLGALTTLMIVSLCCLGMAASASTESNNFDAVVHAVDQQYHLHGTRISMMWAISLVARGVTHGGVRGMRVVTYERLPENFDRAAVETTVRSQLGQGWSPMVRSKNLHDGSGETSLVYTRPHGKWMEMMVVSLEAHELDLVRMEMNPEALERWQNEDH